MYLLEPELAADAVVGGPTHHCGSRRRGSTLSDVSMPRFARYAMLMDL